MKRLPPCPACRSTRTVRNGHHIATHTQKVTCKDCGAHFRTRYRHHAYKRATARKIVKLTDAGLSVRAIARRLGIAPTTVWTRQRASAGTYAQQRAASYPIPQSVLHVVAWSGGKDSSALLVWALEHLPHDSLRVIFCDTGWEAPETYRFIEETNQRLLGGRLIVLRSQQHASLLELARHKGRFPSTKARFCTEHLKIIPMIEWILTQPCDLAVYQGIRAEESPARRAMPVRGEYFASYLDYEQDPYIFKDGIRQRRRQPALYPAVMDWLEAHECSVERPLFHWKAKDVLTLCRQHGVLNPLYDMGCDRVGCFPCIMAKKQDIRVLAGAHPEQVDTIAAAEQTLQSTFFPYSKLPPRFGGTPTIRDVVRWATEAEGQEVSTPDLPCMSHYAACE